MTCIAIVFFHLFFVTLIFRCIVLPYVVNKDVQL